MTTNQRLETESGAVRRLLAVVVGLVLALLGLTLTAGPAAAGNVVGPQPVNSILSVGPHGTAGQETIGVRGPPLHQQASATGVAAETAGDGTAVIGKVKDLQSVGDSEYTLLDRLPDQGSPKANWKRNSGVLRQVMSRGAPIRDASVGSDGQLIQYPGSFLNAERNLLTTKGWTYDPKTTLWMPPGG